MEKAFEAAQSLLEKIKYNTSLIRANFDDKSSARVLDVAKKIIQSLSAESITKPHSSLRQFKMRKKLGYCKF
ncbi:MAG: hypothetical protein ACJAWQ_002570 [Paraglaciecola sp.]|jgi:hypothetical protein|uniref:hypothetical protein n=1 Tax=uncultured Paraglaciecola sp. TaxID=1765024 RepID=UPI0026010D2B|nr:hypothetical protein [uncultured Paraglaciecola sp.]